MEMRGHSGGESKTDRYGNEVKRETDTNFSLTFSLYLPFKKKKRVRPNKTFIIPGKLFNVFDIKRLKGGRERKKSCKKNKNSSTDI